jgi:colicin import membrane protein
MNGTLSTQNASGVQSDPLRRVGRSVLVAIGITLFAAPTAAAPDEVKQYVSAKEYAAHLLQDTQQYKCLATLYGKESAWNDKAVNGSHYGIPQGRSIYLKTADKYEQIRWGLGYIEVRYGTPCAALRFFRENNYH